MSNEYAAGAADAVPPRQEFIEDAIWRNNGGCMIAARDGSVRGAGWVR